MISLLAAVIAISHPTPQAVVERFGEYMKKNPSFEVTFVARSGRFDGFQGRFLNDAGKRQMLYLKRDDVDYAYLQTFDRGIEVEHTEKEYSEVPGQGRLSLPPAEVFPLAYALHPRVHLVNRLDRIAAPNATLTYVESTRIDGVATDHIRWEFQTMQGKQQIDAFVAESGVLKRFDVQIASAEQIIDTSSVFKTFKTLSQMDGLFVLDKQPGYVPFRIESYAAPLEIGEKWPTIGLAGAALANHKGKPHWVLITDTENPASEGMRQALKEQKIAHTEIAVGGTQAAQGIILDPKGAVFGEIRIQGTPYLYFVDDKGMIAGTWFGWNAARTKQVKQEWVDAVEALNEKE